MTKLVSLKLFNDPLHITKKLKIKKRPFLINIIIHHIESIIN